MRIREIPYNYTSFSDREIVLRFMGPQSWENLEALRSERRTGRSARLLFEILGDVWIVSRNPLLQGDLSQDPKRLRALLDTLQQRLDQIQARSEGNPRVLELLARAREMVDDFSEGFAKRRRFRQDALRKLARITRKDNLDFSAVGRVAHVTDATDWRVAYPALVISPDAEAEAAPLAQACIDMGLTLIPRGGGTGYTGGAIPLHPDTAIINTEKLNHIGPVEMAVPPGLTDPAPTIRVEAGAVTRQVADAAEAAGFVFAVDPTSQNASTIGGNIAMNAGGKKAVLWGTTIDNLLSWRLVDPDGCWLEVTRLDHNLGRIHDQPKVRFRIRRFEADGVTPVGEPEIRVYPGAMFRKAGLGKDVTDKALGGLPGIQKEGCDGLVTSAVFILHRMPTHQRTVCMEFYGADLSLATPAIVEVKNHLDANPKVLCTGLEHLDDRYVKAVGYSPKGARRHAPKMVLLADLAADDPEAADSAAAKVAEMVQARDGEGFIAASPAARKRFWADRGRAAAIAAHTNAFKINEDVVIPLERLDAYTRGIERINIEQSIRNKRVTVAAVRTFLLSPAFLEQLPAGFPASAESEAIIAGKTQAAVILLDQINALWGAYLDGLDRPPPDEGALTGGDSGPPGVSGQENPQALGQTLLDQLLRKERIVSYRRSVERPLKQIFGGDLWLSVRDRFDALHAETRASRLFVALHMHAGDGNVHTNIPVNSNDYQMLGEAHRMVDRIMDLARDLGGEISGEHGIGLTKFRYLDKEKANAFARYKAKVDPHGRFNRGKLLPGSGLDDAYTPSLRLVQQEALILQESALGALNDDVRNCLRCGKCKPVCTTHVPRANLLYSPRNKILATGLIIEAFLYEEQTRRGLSIRHFDRLNDLADHCTVCHRCLTPCPVNIDFGQVTVRMREILEQQGKKKSSLANRLSLAFLTLNDPKWLRLIRRTVIRGGYALQPLAHGIAKRAGWLKAIDPPPATHGRPAPLARLLHDVARPLPAGLPARSARTLLGIHDSKAVPLIRNEANPEARTVFYFPGCGCERLFSDLSLAVMALLHDQGVQVVLPPAYLCCGFPQAASGQQALGRRLSTDNRVLFHRLANAMAYLEIKEVLVSCGTCLIQLEGYDFPRIFPNSRLLDAHEFFRELGMAPEAGLDAVGDRKAEGSFLFHDPCHSPARRHDPVETAALLTGARGALSDRCCAEAGTFAVNRPDVATQARLAKSAVLQTGLARLRAERADQPGPGDGGPAKTPLLTTCPSCLQGLSRYAEEAPIAVDFLARHLARQRLGPQWREAFLTQVRNGALERVIF